MRLPKLPPLAEIRKTQLALGAGLAVMVGAGLITGDLAVWLTTGLSAVGAAVAVFAGPANAPKP